MKFNVKDLYIGKKLRRRVENDAKLARFLAKTIDFGICALLIIFVKYIGTFVALGFILTSDFFNNGQSPGKKCFGLKVLRTEDFKPCSLKQSAIRNLPFALAALITCFGAMGLANALLIMLLFGGYEYYLLSRENNHYRLGDIIAETTVVANDPKAEHFINRMEILNLVPNECPNILQKAF